MVTEQKELRKHFKGGSFLIEHANPQDIFTPEDFTEEHLMIAQTTEEFVENEVMPRVDEIEHQKLDVTVELLRKAGDMGLLSVEIPEKFGGLGLDKMSVMLVTEKMTAYGSFAVSHGGHTGIGTGPIALFGTEEQKAKYLPKFASGELLSSYALTEAGSGSDALAAKATAVLSEDGKYYLLNGEKMWITNAGFADVFITFAKIDGDKFSCFIVEKGMPGVSTGAEEKKMGIKGSSTRVLLLDNVKVPVENLLGEVGKGHKIAFNILNFGRFKLGAGAVGGAKHAITDAVRYANQRFQFGKPISSFGAIKHKIGEMAIETWVLESMVYRTAGMIDSRLEGIDRDDTEATMAAVEEYAIECSIMKVFGSEVLDYVVDEEVQIHGGYGYSSEYPAERAYRDSRINRIFEGTNEINRMLIPGMLLKRAMKGELALMPAAMKLMDEVMGFPELAEEDETLLAAERKIVANAKKIALLVAGTAVQKFMNKISDEQEILMHMADIVMETYAMESAVLRTIRINNEAGSAKSGIYIDVTRTFINDSIARIDFSAKQALAAITDGDELRTLLAALRRFTKYTPINTVKTRQAVADKLIDANKYAL
jgi:alkylation response protein AidB-like acyl-CoA dehydrogenase